MRLRLSDTVPSKRLAAALLLASALLALAASRRVASAQQGDAMAGLGQEYAQLEAQGLKENFQRQLSYLMLQEYLPPGTRMTSGYRSPDKQLDLILRMARSNGIPAPDHAAVADEASWRPVLNALRAKGFIVASPTHTPHGTDEDVFDLAGAPLDDIKAGLAKAEAAGMVKYHRVIYEPQNNAIHVEVESLSPKVLNTLGARFAAKGSSPSPASAGVGSSPPSPANEQGVMQQLQSAHDAEPDPAKKIDYDRSIINLLDPTNDAARISALNEEIRQHQRDADALSGDAKKKQAIADVTSALRDERYEDAEKAAIFLARNYPDVKEARGMVVQIRTRRLVNEASDAIYSSEKPDYAQCQQADKLLTAALKLSPDYEGAQFIRADIDSCLRRGRNKRLALAGVAVLLLGGVGVGLFFLARSQGWLAGASDAAGGIAGGGAAAAQGWAVEVIEGAGRGLVFALAKPETIIGSKGPPEGAADIVILDAERKISRRHCTIAQQPGRFYLVDESTNGTKINGRPAPRGSYVEFRAGDQINLADVSVVVVRPG